MQVRAVELLDLGHPFHDLGIGSADRTCDQGHALLPLSLDEFLICAGHASGNLLRYLTQAHGSSDTVASSRFSVLTRCRVRSSSLFAEKRSAWFHCRTWPNSVCLSGEMPYSEAKALTYCPPPRRRLLFQIFVRHARK